MTEVRPFRALRYDPARVALDRVLAPPYDVVTNEERGRLWERDPHNAVRLELTRDEREEGSTDYAEVARTLAAWEREGVLRRDARPALYALRQAFTAPDGARRVRDGFLALLRLEDYTSRVVRPHERTLSGPKADRLKLLRATRANLSPVFLLYEDREGELDARLAAWLEHGAAAVARDGAGTEHRLVPVEDAGAIELVRDFLAKRLVVIADGHHRYETALAYRDEQRAAKGRDVPSEWVLAGFANAFAPGNLLLPIHRVVRQAPAPDDAGWAARLPGWSVERLEAASGEELPQLLARRLAPLRGEVAFVADDGSGVVRLIRREKPSTELPIRVIHQEVLEGVFGLDEAAVRDGAVLFAKSVREATEAVRAGRGSVALYLNALVPDDVFRVTGAGELLPQKSTFFVPKLPTGLAFRLLEGGAR